MARIAGVNIPTNKRVIIALTYIHGIGRTKAQSIVDKLGIDHARRVQDLSDQEVVQIRETIDAEQFVALLEGASEEEVFPPESSSDSTEEEYPSEPEPVNKPTTDPAPSPPRPGYAGGMTDMRSDRS